MKTERPIGNMGKARHEMIGGHLAEAVATLVCAAIDTAVVGKLPSLVADTTPEQVDFLRRRNLVRQALYEVAERVRKTASELGEWKP